MSDRNAEQWRDFFIGDNKGDRLLASLAAGLAQVLTNIYHFRQPSLN